MQPWPRVFFGIALALASVGCTTPRDRARDRSTTMNYLALGDSYTIGEGVDEAGRWPVQLARALRGDGIGLREPRIIATTGWTTDELDAAMDVAEPLGEFDFVSLAIGVNNQYRGGSVVEYRSQFAALLQRAIGLTGGRADRVLVLSIPDWGITPFAFAQGRDRAQIAHQIDAFNASAAAVSAEHGVAFVDITPTSREHGDDTAMLVEDGLHPSAAMYALWVKQALPVARDLLAQAQ